MNALQTLVTGGGVIDLILLLMALEALVLLVLWRRRGAALSPRRWLGTLAAGACLLLAWRAWSVGAAWPFTGVALTGALLAHLLDLRARLR